MSELYDLANEENNQSILSECFKRIEELKIKTKKNETKCFLSNESDIFDCYIEIHAGAGGTESQDWAAMLRRMYMKWSLRKEFKTQLISEHKGDEAGIKSSIIKIEFQFSSQSFLQHQVRSMVGCLKYLGEKKWDLKTFEKRFKSKKRTLCAPPAPPSGLFLFRVLY